MTIEKNEANKRLIEKINQVEEGYIKDFSNTQKILLTTDGSITAIFRCAVRQNYIKYLRTAL